MFNNSLHPHGAHDKPQHSHRLLARPLQRRAHITPIGKQLPVELLKQLRPISNLPICNKNQEAVIADLVISDMKMALGPTQFGNQKKTSTQHYLVSLVHRIETNVDNNSKREINLELMSFIDYIINYIMSNVINRP